MADDNTLIVRRWMPIPRADVFDAWLDPEKLARFMRPGTVSKATADIDPRVGGRFRIVMAHGGNDAEHWGEYLAIDRPKLLSFTWTSANTDGIATIVTVEFHEQGDGTEVVLTHRGLPGRTRDAHDRGWTDIVERLATTASRPSGDPTAGTP